MARFRRDFTIGGTYFFTVNLADRGSRLLVDHIADLRAAFVSVRRRHPFAINAIVVLLIGWADAPERFEGSPFFGER